ncbi:MAG: hypothetical protein ACUVX8_05415 [Candidatus Zipacnadales bacterium]
MPTEKSKKPKSELPATEEPIENEEAPDEEVEESESELEETSVPAQKGGSGALVAIIAILIVVVLVVFAWWQRQEQQQRKAEELARQRQVMGTQLATVQDNIKDAQRQLQAETPNVDGAIEALNDAAAQLGAIAQSALASEDTLTAQLVDLQSQVQKAAKVLAEHYAAYRATIEAAEEELKEKANGDIEPLLGKIGNLVTAAHGDVDTPIISGPRMTTEKATGEQTTPTEKTTRDEIAEEETPVEGKPEQVAPSSPDADATQTAESKDTKGD